MILAEKRPDRRQSIGLLGEEAAATELSRAGLRVLERRYRRRVGEIDIVAEQGELLVFVEVKTRSGGGFGAPAEAITPIKRRRLARAALSFLSSTGQAERPCRFDVVEVVVARGRVIRVHHIEDAFGPAADRSVD